MFDGWKVIYWFSILMIISYVYFHVADLLVSALDLKAFGCL
jgi:hypothetical protein